MFVHKCCAGKYCEGNRVQEKVVQTNDTGIILQQMLYIKRCTGNYCTRQCCARNVVYKILYRNMLHRQMLYTEMLCRKRLYREISYRQCCIKQCTGKCCARECCTSIGVEDVHCYIHIVNTLISLSISTSVDLLSQIQSYSFYH